MGSDATRLLDEFRAWLADKDGLLPAATIDHYRRESHEDDTARVGRVVSERRAFEDVPTPLPVPVRTRDVDLTVLHSILEQHPLGPLDWEPGDLSEAVQQLVRDETFAPAAFPRVVPTLRAFVRFAARTRPDTLRDVGVLTLEDDLDDADVLIGLAMQLRGIEHQASARTARTRAIATVDCYALDDFYLPLAVRAAVPVARAQEQAAESTGLAVVRDVLAFVGKGRRVTDNGNLVLTDVRRLADVLGVTTLPTAMRSMLDVPAVAFAFRWALASGFLARVGGRVAAGGNASLLTDDPARACLAALRGLTSVPTMLIPARQWRPLPEDFAPGMLPALLAVVYEYGETTRAELEQLGWHRCTHTYDTARLSDSANELNRRIVATDVRHLCRRLGLLGIVEIDGDAVTLTALGTWALQHLLPDHGFRTPLTGGFDLPFDALLERIPELPVEAVRSELAAWGEHHGTDAAHELVRVVTQGTSTQRSVACYALRALPAEAEPAVRRLLDDPGVRPHALAWLSARGLADPPHLTPSATAEATIDALAAVLLTADEDELRDVWLGLQDPAQRAGLAEQLSRASSPYTADVLEQLVSCDPDRRVVKAARRALFKVRCR